MNRRSGMLAFAAALALTALSACSPEVPAHPTYTNDVAPILDAHCVRCHGANDMLNDGNVLHANGRLVAFDAYCARRDSRLR